MQKTMTSRFKKCTMIHLPQIPEDIVSRTESRQENKFKYVCQI